MGEARPSRRHQDGGRPLSELAARVVPNVPSFAVDDGFWYAVPHQLGEVDVGSMVRVPLGGRRVRGWVVELDQGRDDGLKEIAGLSSEVPVFDAALMRSLTAAAHHYVAPISVMLAKAGPPNLPKAASSGPSFEADGGVIEHRLTDIARHVAAGRRRPTQALLGRWQQLDWLGALTPILSGGGSAVVVAASAAEVARISGVATEFFEGSLLAMTGESDAALTAQWEQAQSPGRLIVGTPRVAAWMVSGLSLAVVLEEGRRAMKERQTPTVHVRELMRIRSLVEGFSNVFFGPTPSVEILASGAEVVMVGNRAWPLVEVVDRSEEPPGTAQISSPAVAALRAMIDGEKKSFVFTSHKMAEQTASELNARLGAPVAGLAPHDGPVVVGTERDLAGRDPVALTVATNVDAMLMSPSYRAAEEALRQLARLANLLKPGPGHRMMVQTFEPRSSLVETLRKGDPIPFLERVLLDRARSGLPPSTEMIAVELRGEIPELASSDLRELPGANVAGPMPVEGGERWLLEGDLRIARLALRGIVGRWRDTGTTVRVDADPIDL